MFHNNISAGLIHVQHKEAFFADTHVYTNILSKKQKLGLSKSLP